MGLPKWTWPDWRKAKPGTRFRHVRSGATGTYLRPSKCKHNGAIVKWDAIPSKLIQPDKECIFVTIALDAEPIQEES